MSAFWDGFEKRAGLKDVASKSWKAVSALFRGAKDYRKSVVQAPKDVSRAAKIVQRSAAGAAGAYGLSKALEAPKHFQEYKYYKRQNESAEKK